MIDEGFELPTLSQAIIWIGHYAIYTIKIMGVKYFTNVIHEKTNPVPDFLRAPISGANGMGVLL